MKRLTKRNKEINGEYKQNHDVWTSECINKLGEYEDLEEQNLMAIKPCHIGDTFYVVTNNPTIHTAVIYEVVECRVSKMYFSRSNEDIMITCRGHYKDGCPYSGNFRPDSIDKIIFSNKENAITKADKLNNN